MWIDYEADKPKWSLDHSRYTYRLGKLHLMKDMDDSDPFVGDGRYEYTEDGELIDHAPFT